VSERIKWALAAVTALAPGPVAAQGAPVVIAILPFEDRGSYGQPKEVFRALQLGIPATIARELSGHPELRLADPTKLKRAIEAQRPPPSGRIDATIAARIGKEAGARYAITGSFADFYGEFRLDARVIDTENGSIRKVVSNDDPQLQKRTELYRIVQAVGHKVLAEASPGRTSPLDNDSRIVPTDALTHYSLGLLYEQQGDRSRAAQQYNEALSTFPNYPDARDAARRVGP